MSLTIVMLAAGCQLPVVHVNAGARVAADAKVSADAKVTTIIMPVVEGGPVKAMSLDGEAADCQQAKIAVVDVDGLLVNADFTGLASLGENPVSLFRERLDAIAVDSSVVAVVVRINSPGGGVTATDVMWHDLQNFKNRTKLPIVACLLDIGTGGAYYLATAADQIIAHPTSVTGGVGVILNRYNMQDAMAQFNIVGAPIKSGKNVDLGTPIAPLDDEQKKMLQAMADEFHDRFKRVIAQCRPDVDQSLKTNFDGRIFTAQQARDRRLIDGIGYLDDAINMARDLSHQDCCEPVFFHRANDPARSPYAVTPNVPLQNTIIPVSLPGYDRSRLPSFLYIWQPDPSMEKMSGR
jgi:protease IV